MRGATDPGDKNPAESAIERNPSCLPGSSSRPSDTPGTNQLTLRTDGRGTASDASPGADADAR